MNVLRLPAVHPARFTPRFAFGFPVGRLIRSPRQDDRQRCARQLIRRFALFRLFSRRLLDLPSSHGTLAPVRSDRLTPTPCSPTPVERSRLTISACSCCPRSSNVKGLNNASISELYHTARCSLSTLRAVVTFDYAKLACGWWLTFTALAFTRWVPTDGFDHRLPLDNFPLP